GGPTMMSAAAAGSAGHASADPHQNAATDAADSNNLPDDDTGVDYQSLDPVLLKMVIEQVRGAMPTDDTPLDARTNVVLDLGLDSLQRLQIARDLESRFGGRFPEEVLEEIETVGQIAAAITRDLPEDSVREAISRFRSGVARSTSTKVRRVPKEQQESDFDQFVEYERLQQTKRQMLQTGIPNPYFSLHEGSVRDTTSIDGKEYVSFASYNYLGTSGDADVNAATVQAVNRYGTSTSASRLVSGERPLHRDLESGLAEWIGVDNAITMVGGHATNETTIGHLVGAGDLIVHDGLSHNSIVQGALLSGAARQPFPHNDFDALDRMLATARDQYRRVLIIVEGVYSMDGDFPDLPKFIEVKKRHNALLMVDEAHSIGTMGETGRGIGQHFAINPRDVDVWMGTMSKSFGSCGGYIAGSNALVELLRYTAPGFVFSCGLPPAAAAASLASLQILKDQPQRVAKLQSNSRLFLNLVRDGGLDTGPAAGTPVVPVITGNSMLALRLSDRMMADGINVQPILYPAVDESAARLRFFITSTHSETQLRNTAETVIRHSNVLREEMQA
ncbi:MAG: aminotransferase class I/II-fold pyridoxal phosphate-dependent enzyme, partial [Planctomycetota bacterium]